MVCRVVSVLKLRYVRNEMHSLIVEVVVDNKSNEILLGQNTVVISKNWIREEGGKRGGNGQTTNIDGEAGLEKNKNKKCEEAGKKNVGS